jgi:hypothetical protein
MRAPAGTTTLLLFLALAGAPVASRQGPAPEEPAAAALSELGADPTWLGRRLCFTLQRGALVEDWNPFLSRFGPARWLCFEAWPDESFTFDAEVFAHPARRLFVRRGSEAERLLRAARTYERFEAVAVVRELFLDEPWIEVETLFPLPGFVGEGTILHAARAAELEAEGQYELAIEQLQRAQAGPLPPHATAELERRVLECRRAQEKAAGGAKDPPRRP